MGFEKKTASFPGRLNSNFEANVESNYELSPKHIFISWKSMLNVHAEKIGEIK